MPSSERRNAGEGALADEFMEAAMKARLSASGAWHDATHGSSHCVSRMRMRQAAWLSATRQLGGQVGVRREHHFGSVSFANHTAARRRISFSISRRRCHGAVPRLGLLRGREAVLDAFVDVGLAHPAPHLLHRHHITFGLGRDFFGIVTSFRPGNAEHKRCQPTVQQSRLAPSDRGGRCGKTAG